MIANHLLRHLQVLLYALGQLAATPLASLMTVGVIAITLALPTGLYVLLENMQRVSDDWRGGAQISLFLKAEAAPEQARALAADIELLPAVAQVKYIPPDEALDEFRRLSGFGDALDALDRNPLPPVVVVWPREDHGTPAELENLRDQLAALGNVDIAQLDVEWVRRLHVILQLAQRAVLLLAGLLAVAVLLIVGNTVRLAILNRRDEIEIIKLIGGTDAFIRRPFLYSGWLQGMLGALAAWLLVSLGLALLGGPVRDLAGLYASRFELAGLDPGAGLILLAAGGALGWLASRIAVGRHLRSTEPV